MIKMLKSDSAEIPEALNLVWRVFLEFEAPDYPEEGIREFKKFIDENAVRQRMKNNEFFMWCYFEDGKIVGVIASRQPSHISLLFVDKEYHRKGIARDLFNTLISYYSGDSTCREIIVNSSPYALEVYRRLGFVDTGTEQTVNGLRFIPMKMSFI